MLSHSGPTGGRISISRLLLRPAGLLLLRTNRYMTSLSFPDVNVWLDVAAMNGKPLTMSAAWRAYDLLFEDNRVALLPEPDRSSWRFETCRALELLLQRSGPTLMSPHSRRAAMERWSPSIARLRTGKPTVFCLFEPPPQAMGPRHFYHKPTSFHHHIPTPSQITRFITEIRNPIRHQSVCRT